MKKVRVTFYVSDGNSFTEEMEESKWEEREKEVFKNGYKSKHKEITQKYPPGSLIRTEIVEI